MRNIRWRSALWSFTLLTLGALIGSISVVVFMAPFNIAPGGVSGISVILNKVIGTPIGVMTLILNVPIMYVGYRMLGGWKVIATTVYVVVLYSVTIDLFEKLPTIFSPGGVSHDVLLNALFGGILGGISSGMVYAAGGTFGGTSTLGRIIQLKWGLPLSTTGLYTDTLVIVLAGIAFRSWEAALYAMVALFVGGVATDYVLEGPSVIRTAIIITDKPKEVSQAILGEMQRGVTAWQGIGMFTEKPHSVLFVTVARPQVNILRRMIAQIDPNAFVVIGQGHVAYGEGFKPMRAGELSASEEAK
jgi:uncharacterized membrane-anchored protein YitT (DUF2179 family)